MAQPPDVLAFLDYRAYLRAYFAFAQERGLSHRGLARRAGLRSPSFLKSVMEGNKTLAAKTAARVARACRLEAEGVEYFVCLVAFNQARDADTKRVAYERLQTFGRWRRIHALDLARDEYFSCWYLPAIRELVASEAFVEDPRWIAKQLRPRVKVPEARKALRTLESLGLLQRDDEGRLRQTDTSVSSGLETGSLQLARYHRTMMARASEAIDTFAREERDLGSLTLCVDDEALARLKRRLQEFRRELLLDEPSLAGRRNRVVQINLQMFPLSAALDEAPRGKA
ncbi:MAG: TIGR02147 family protein [Sandaracinus sp.]|nr:TIGR02147 family protein [Myxococcales bacterium]MCB9604490.1 TIGR02147 family protein [Sandaracinus sp.]MCB9621368.1 TIGR02147 family protein [Sandaracinus sp.]